MKRFEHVNATSLANAVSLLGAANARPIAGGTDLLSEMKLGIIGPDRLVNLKTIPGLNEIRFDEAGGLCLGALAHLDVVAEHSAVRSRYPELSQAIASAASPQLRNQGTIAGNLCQDSRCWYYRGQFYCWLKGGATCYAKEGENAHHAIVGYGPCHTVHPSDLAPALIALGGRVRIFGPNGERTMPLEQLFQRPREGARRLITLEPAEVIVEVSVPTPPPGSRGIYLKAMERQVWAFAQASVAAQLVLDGRVVREARLVLGGIAPTPWHISNAEAAISGSQLDDTSITRAAELAVRDARPLGHNGYKVPLVQGIIHAALTSLRT